MNAITTLVISSILNTLWQAVLLSFVVWAGLRLTQWHVNAATRYVIWWLTLTAVFILPFVLKTPVAPSAPEPTSAPSIQRELPARIAAPLAPPISAAPVTVTQQRAAQWPLWVFAVWASTFALGTLRLVGSYLYLRGVKRRATAWACPLPALRRPVRVLLSDEVTSPGAVGFRHPAIIMPGKLRDQLTVDELSGALWHEAAHLARYDDWLNLIQRVLAAATALHPVIWWILRQIQREREIACDEWVVAQTGAARSYAESLVRIAELVVVRRESALASGIFSDRSRLRARIELLVRSGRMFSARVARSAIGTAALALVGLALAGAVAPRWFAFTQRTEFEVASIRENTDNASVSPWPRRSGEFVSMRNTRIFSIIYYAYHLTGNYQIEGMEPYPEQWLWYDINAKAPKDATDGQIRLMLQSLLADRFKLKLHRETREIPEYELVVYRDKPKLQPASSGPMQVTVEGRTYSQPEGTCGTSLWHEGARWVCHAVKMPA
jgi:beta-lactamase regulating signal transducer with metallopeptidase domain